MRPASVNPLPREDQTMTTTAPTRNTDFTCRECGEVTTPQPDPPRYPPAQAPPYSPANRYAYPPTYPPAPVYPSVQMPAYLPVYPQPLVQVQRVDRNGIGTAGLVLGIIAAGFSLIPVVGVIAWGIWPVGLVLAWVG